MHPFCFFVYLFCLVVCFVFLQGDHIKKKKIVDQTVRACNQLDTSQSPVNVAHYVYGLATMWIISYSCFAETKIWQRSTKEYQTIKWQFAIPQELGKNCLFLMWTIQFLVWNLHIMQLNNYVLFKARCIDVSSNGISPPIMTLICGVHDTGNDRNWWKLIIRYMYKTLKKKKTAASKFEHDPG